MSRWPTLDKPDQKYKVVSAYISLSMDQTVIERQTYSLLEWLGDVGGLSDMLFLIGKLLISPIAAFALKAELLSQAFRFTLSLNYKEKRLKKQQSLTDASSVRLASKDEAAEKAEANLRWDFKNLSRIEKEGGIVTCMGCNRRARYKSMLAKAKSSLNKEMNLVKFLQRSRLISFVALATLNRRQQFVADKMATMIIRESSDLDESTDDDFELE